MKCPHCNDVTLVMSERQGVEIDYCPQCRGVWLDRGELDKLIAHDVAAAPASQPAYPQPGRRPDFEDSDYRHNSGYGRRKPKSWLSEIFD
jgi:Zn-finger nucleic acid-binding protein